MKRGIDICIIGGAGHVGLPLGLAFAQKGLHVLLFDTNAAALGKIKRGQMPFAETNAQSVLRKTLNKTLHISENISDVALASYVIVAIGTPVDEHLNPRLRTLLELFGELKPYLRPEQTTIIRSTVYPGTCSKIANTLCNSKKKLWHIAYCPERTVQGKALVELPQLPQIVSGLTPKAVRSAKKLFCFIAPSVVEVTMEEAELAKLFSNAWRYIQFALANQFYMIAGEFGVDFNKVRKAMVKSYGRASTLPTAGFAAGPCLLKDTLQLAAFNNNNFSIGNAAVMVNEGLPNFIVEQLRQRYFLPKTSVGILGMAFKADIDDGRDALSYKLGKILRFHGARVYCSDEYLKDVSFVSKEILIKRSAIVIIGVPHVAYKNLSIPKQIELIDLWGIVKKD